MRKLALLLWAIGLLASACQSTSPEEVVLSQMEPWNSGDVEAAMELYADDASVKIQPALPPGSPDQHSGKAELRAWFNELAAMNFELDVEVVKVDGNTVTTRTETWSDPTREIGVAPLIATEVYTVEDGKIAGWTWTLSDESLAAIEAAMVDAQAAPAAAKVTFDGEACYYEGPAAMSAQAEVTFEFEPSVEPDLVALVVGPLREDFTWEEVLDYSAENPAGHVPPYAAPGYQIQYGPGSLAVTVDTGSYYVVCATSPEHTNSAHPAALIKVREV